MPRRRTNPDFLNGVPELLILRLLDRQPMHGYELVETIRLASADVLQFGEGCVYPVLHRLQKTKLLTSRRESVGGRSRVVYRLTKAGRRRLAETTSEWRRIVAAVSQVMEDQTMSQTSLNPLRSALVAKGLPADYIRRTIDELADHLVDADNVDADDRLGSPRLLAKQFAREYRARSFAGRHPVASLLLLTLVLMHVIVIGYYVAVTLTAHIYAWLSGLPLAEVVDEAPLPIDELGPGLFMVLHVLYALGAFVPYALIAWFASRHVRKMGRGRRAGIAVFAVVALLAGMCMTNMTLAQSAGERSTLTLGYALSLWAAPGNSPTILLRCLLQALAVVTCGWWFSSGTFAGERETTKLAEDATTA